MSAGLSSKIELNPEITGFFSGLRDMGRRATASKEGSSKFANILLIVIMIGAVIGLFVWYARKARLFETPSNINRIGRDAIQAQAHYAKQNVNRKSLRDYLQSLQNASVPAAHLCLGNFYVSTVNATGLFFPATDGVFSAEAARAAVLAGARGFVFDIWPDLTPGAQFAPSLQVVESGSLWRRISLNQIAFITVLRALIQEAFQVSERPGKDDPVFLYLRFRGKPRTSTFTATANALRATMEQYRLDASFNAGRGQADGRLATSPITYFFRRVIICANTFGEGTALADYVNVGPQTGIKLEYAYNEPRGLNSDMRADAIHKIKQNITWMAPISEDSAAEDNAVDLEAAQGIGIQCVAMNFWNNNDTLAKYMAPDMFGVQSFAIKPVGLRYVITTLPNPGQSQDPGWGSGSTAGTLNDPPALQMP